jgi:hypothetical protein
MFLGFQKELFHGAPHRSCKKVHTGDGIVKFDGLLFFLNGLEKLGCLPVPSVLSVVAYRKCESVETVSIDMLNLSLTWSNTTPTHSSSREYVRLKLQIRSAVSKSQFHLKFF